MGIEVELKSSEANAEKNRLSDELSLLNSESAPNVLPGLDISKIRAALNHMVDLSKPTISEALIDEFVDTITPVENYKFRWKLSLSNAPCPVKTDLIHVVSAPILRFTIDFETAKSYRETRNMDCRFRKSQWNDIEVEVYL